MFEVVIIRKLYPAVICPEVNVTEQNANLVMFCQSKYRF